MDISGNAMIVGGGGGIGRTTALAFAEAGAAAVVIADLSLDNAQSAAEEAKARSKQPGFRAEAVRIDVTSQESVDSAFKQMVETFERIDYCVNCAGIPVRTPRPIEHQDVAEFLQTQNVNVNGTFLVLRAVTGIMKAQDARPNFPDHAARGRTRGAVVSLGSGLSVVASPFLAQYTTSKHAVVGLARTAALDCAKSDIRVNVVCPSWVEGPMMQEMRENIEGVDGLMKSMVPMGRMAASEEIADAILFLCSPRASMMTGAVLMVDGGATANAGYAG
ncbi:NAD(P)-binding protein [Xylariaceae sp. FL0804]|nr:NAD(P)-binding protein [Xylariaceae sp. FL0804]